MKVEVNEAKLKSLELAISVCAAPGIKAQVLIMEAEVIYQYLFSG